jgi:dihydrofolate synthase/folylpolyglutamate synthase
VEVEGVSFLFDVAHNTAGIEALAHTLALRPLPQPTVLLVGILGDKEWRTMLPPLFGATDRAVLTLPLSAPPERCWDPAEVMAAVESPGPVEIIPDFVEAVGVAMERARGGSVLVVGSHHTTGDAMRILEIEPFGSDPGLPGSDPSF